MSFLFENEREMDTHLAEVAAQAEKYMKSQVNVLFENTDLFIGDVYKDESKLPGKRLKTNIIANPARLAKKFKMRARFIVGYEVKGLNLFYEIWYLPFYGKYILVDKFGRKPKGYSGESARIKDVIDHLFDIVSTHDEVEDERELDRYAGRASRKAERDYAGFNDTDARYNQFSSYNPEETEQWRVNLLESNVASRQMLNKMINTNIEQYDQTKMNRHKISRLWTPILGRKIEYPSKFQGGIFSKLLKIFGKDKEATFVTGFTFLDKINVEIWFVKSLATGKGSFFVFDLTSAKIVAKNLSNMRQAYQEVAEKLSADPEYDD
jgi:hypothetical protein